ncbi:MAG: penicillin-binding protein activator LpoB [Pseudomonadota bacterium]
MKHTLMILTASLLILSSCSSNRAFTKGEYTDPDRVILLDDRYNESDMKIMADALVDSLMKNKIITAAKGAPVFQVETVSNSTDEHIDMQSLTDKIRTALIKSGKVQFHDKLQRKTLSDEYSYQTESGNVNKETAKGKGHQVGADYILAGDFASNVQELGGKKVIYYKLTLNATDIKTGLITWTEEKAIKKLFKKRSYAL